MLELRANGTLFLVIKHILLTILLIVLPQLAFADSKTEILHSPLKSGELPRPGEPFDITVYLKNTRDFESKLKTIVIRDGELMELPQIEGMLDINDTPKYSHTFYAPKYEISYQFILQTKDGLVSSPRYQIKRSCVPSTELTKAPDKKDSNEFLSLVTASQGLDRDIKGYNITLNVLTSLQKILGEKK